MARLSRVMMIEQGGRGGVADYHMALSAALARQGWEVEVATARDHLYPSVEGRRIHGVFPYVRDRGLFSRMLRRTRMSRVLNGLAYVATLGTLWRLARTVRVVHLQAGEWPPLIALTMLVLRGARRPVVYTPHNTFDRGAHQFRRANGLAYQLASAIVVHSRYDLEQLREPDRQKAHVIPHGEYGWLAATGSVVDRDAARRQLDLPVDAPVTILFGQLRPDKGVDDLLRAARGVPDLHVILAGKDLGVLAQVEPLLDDPSLAGRVLVREGFVPIQEAASLFAAADTVALPYSRASASGVMLLAYGFERAVVAYPVGALAEYVVDGETGWLCTAADPDALAAALHAAVSAGSDECMRRGRAARRLSDERFSWDAIARTTASLYQRLLDAQGVGSL